jgi:plasmid replication initiation protein
MVVTSFTRWLASVEAKGSENQEIYVAFSPNFERIWLESKKRLPEYVSQKPANIRLRSQYALRLYGWAKKYVEVGKKAHPFGAAPKAPWSEVEGCGREHHPRSSATDLGELSPTALDVAILEINKKTDLRIEVESLERSKHRRVTSVTFSIQEQAVAIS